MGMLHSVSGRAGLTALPHLNTGTVERAENGDVVVRTVAGGDVPAVELCILSSEQVGRFIAANTKKAAAAASTSSTSTSSGSSSSGLVLPTTEAGVLDHIRMCLFASDLFLVHALLPSSPGESGVYYCVWPSADVWWGDVGMDAVCPERDGAKRWVATARSSPRVDEADVKARAEDAPEGVDEAQARACIDHVRSMARDGKRVWGGCVHAMVALESMILCVNVHSPKTKLQVAVLDVRSNLYLRLGNHAACLEDANRLVLLGYPALGCLRKGSVLLAESKFEEAEKLLTDAEESVETLTTQQRATWEKRLLAARTGAKSSRGGSGSGAGSGAGAGGGDGDGDGGDAPVKSSRYPSTPHLPFSPGVNPDDIKLSGTCSQFVGIDVVVTEKLDGGNCCITDGKVYARTHGHEATHASFGPIKTLCSRIQAMGMLEPGVKLFGENMFGVHSIEYDNLEDFFYLFGVQDADGSFRAWDDVVEMADMLGIPHAPVAFRGTFSSLDAIRKFMVDAANKPSAVAIETKPEGFVIRLPGGYTGADFERCMAKYVRASHIQTDETWLRTWKKAVLHAHTKKARK